ncbi:ABC transporter substrate-binding protein [Cohnella cellulosilytica]|uniref:ABC transporter substrate-binding protein n=1 Tax=Cohnella cellulosilytica TaxID=986710 RepID=A0ABW2FHV0_9BACL
MAAAILLSFVLVLAGCGGENNKASSSATTAPSASPQTDEQEPALRTVRHSLGEIAIPANPQRIVVLNYMPIDHLLSLGIQPVAVATMDGLNYPPYLKDRLQGAEPLGDGSEPNLEAILAAQPDLIIAHAGWHAEVYDSLSKIAPTVLQDFPSDKIEWFKETAALFGKEAEAEEIVQAFKKKAEEAKNKLAEAGVNTQTVAIMRVRDKQLQIFKIAEEHEGELFGTENLLQEWLGLSSPNTDGLEFNFGLATLSWELMPEIDPDHIFMLTYPEQGSEAELKELQNNVLWRNLKAVKNNHVHMAENSTWVAGNGMIGLNRVIDEVLEALIED